MKKKHLKIIAIIAFSLFILAIAQNLQSNNIETLVGHLAFKKFKLNEITSVSFADNKKVTELFQDKIWTVKNRFNLPADPAKINNFLRKILRLKIVSEIPFNEKNIKSFALKENQTNYLKIKLSFKNEEKKEFIIGKLTRSAESGQYTGRYLLTPEKKIYLIDDSLINAIADVRVWLKKQLPIPSEVKLVSFIRKKKIAWQARRNKRNTEFTLTLPINFKISKEQLRLLMKVIFNYRFLDTIPSKKPFTINPQFKTERIIFTTWDETYYSLQPLAFSGEYLRLAISINGPNKKSLKEKNKELRKWHFLLSKTAYSNIMNYLLKSQKK